MSGQIEGIQTMLQQMQQLQAQQATRIPPLNHQPSFLPSLSQILGIPAQPTTQTNFNTQSQQQSQPQPAQQVQFQLPAQQIPAQTTTAQPVAPLQQAHVQPSNLTQQQPASQANDAMPASYSREQLQDLFRSVNTRTYVKNTAQIAQELNAGKYTRILYVTREFARIFPFAFFICAKIVCTLDKKSHAKIKNRHCHNCDFS